MAEQVTPLVDQPTAVPTRKVASGGIAGAVATILFALLDSQGIELDPAVVAAVTTLLSFAVAYFTKNRAV